MLQRFRKQFGTAGLVVAVIALVLAMVGAAFAAKGALTPKQKKEVEKIAKNVAKKFPGPAGPQGPAGTNGKDGASGKDGNNGKDGKSVAVGTEPTGTAKCSGLGGASVEVEGEAATRKIACNGKEGSPWVAGTVPSGKIMKGTWAVEYTAAGAGEAIPIALSTSVPINPLAGFGAIMVKKGANLPGEPTAEREEKETELCPGSASSPLPPLLGPVEACFYVQEDTNLAPSSATDLISSGGGLILKSQSVAAGVVHAYGSWELLTQ